MTLTPKPGTPRHPDRTPAGASSAPSATAPAASDAPPFDPDNVPRHIAIIMDGNGRWARTQGLSRLHGHQKGAETIRTVLYACRDWGVKYITLYAFSTENWKRPPEEVEALMQLLEVYLQNEVPELMKENVSLRAIGDVSRLPERTRRVLEESIRETASNTGPILTLALNYGGRDEIVRAARTLVREVAAGRLDPASIDEGRFADALDTAGMPDPDLLIRTAGEMRLSNFLLWQLSYAEYHATEVCWPAFGREELAEAIRAYQGRTRRYGAVVEGTDACS